MAYYGKPRLVKRDDRFVFESSFEYRMPAKNAGFEWDHRKDRKYWYTESIDIARKLAIYADDDVRAEIRKAEQLIEKAIEDSRIVSSGMSIPCPEGKAYLPFQKAGIEFASKRANTLISDDMGLGKSIEAIGVINLDETIENVLVVCPASLKINWRKELENWLVRPMTIGIAKGKTVFPETDVVIANYDILHNFKDELRANQWDIMIVDECHMMKNGNTRRSQQVLGKRRYRHPDDWDLTPIPAKRKLYMSGTPIVNRPIELWPLISSLDPETWNDFGQFTHRYCNAHQGRFGWDMSGAQNLGELQGKLRGSVMLRRTKSEVLTDLPPKLRQVIELSPNGARKVVEAEKAAYSRHQAALRELKVVVELSKASEKKSDYADAVSRLKEGVALAFGEMATARKNTAVAKVPYVIEFLEGVSGKVVVFAHHKEAVKQLKAALGDKAVVLVGDTSINKRNEAVERFQTDADVQYFIGSIQAAGVGLTLTASSHVVFSELDWVPGNVTQAEDRLHRLGQQNSVLVQHLVFDESIDAKMAKTLVRKQTVIDATLDDPELDVPIIPEDEPPATSGTTWKKINEEAKHIQPKTIIAIHSALRYLSNKCDGARMEDGVGFNAYDTDIGKNLAEQPSLTQKQAALGRKILRKYSKQLGKEIMDSIND
jgi:SWI/SNF-related matrix-associated actin-dependent regulator 1 of chromatin subfamily A